jgi:uncharacterized protein YndB with AHSA1/START domain
MNVRIAPAPIRKSITVKATPQRAFEVFATGMGRWWRPDHHLGKSPLKDVVLEPQVGGRWYEVNEDGSSCNWGKVLVWEPPTRLLLAWQLNGDWQYDADFVTELEFRFIPDGNGTRVELEHRNLDRYGDKTDAVRGSLDSAEGWTGALTAYIREVEKMA